MRVSLKTGYSLHAARFGQWNHSLFSSFSECNQQARKESIKDRVIEHLESVRKSEAHVRRAADLPAFPGSPGSSVYCIRHVACVRGGNGMTGDRVRRSSAHRTLPTREPSSNVGAGMPANSPPRLHQCVIAGPRTATGESRISCAARAGRSITSASPGSCASSALKPAGRDAALPSPVTERLDSRSVT